MKGILLCEHLADLDVHKRSRRSQAGGDGEAGLPNRGRNLREHLGRGSWGGNGGRPGEADPGTLGPCRERQMGKSCA